MSEELENAALSAGRDGEHAARDDDGPGDSGARKRSYAVAHAKLESSIENSGAMTDPTKHGVSVFDGLRMRRVIYPQRLRECRNRSTSAEKR